MRVQEGQLEDLSPWCQVHPQDRLVDEALREVEVLACGEEHGRGSSAQCKMHERTNLVSVACRISRLERDPIAERGWPPELWPRHHHEHAQEQAHIRRRRLRGRVAP